jgi:hypothetical protein
VPSKPRLLELVLDAYREGDLHECIRLVRTLVEAAPQATAPRQLLAALFASTGNARQALAHYRRLLPLAVARGEVIRAIAFQKQIDVYDDHEELAPGRWLDLQRQLRERGMPFVSETPGRVGRPWDEAQLVGLPRAWFERIAAETRFEIVGLEYRAVDVEAGTVWEVLSGRMRWSFALPDGRASAESLAAEGDAVHVDPELARTARVTLVPELPVEVLRFDAGLARDLKLALRAGLHVPGPTLAGITYEARAMFPTRPARHEDLDEPVRVPVAGSGVEPLKLPPIEPSEAPAAPGDDGEWVDFGVLSLSDPVPSEDGKSAAEAGSDRPLEPAVPAEAFAADNASVSPEAEALAGDDESRVPATPDASQAPAAAGPEIFELPPLPDAHPRAAAEADAIFEPVAGDEAEAPEAEAPEVDAPEIERGDEWPPDMAEGLQSAPVPLNDQERHLERRRHPRVTVSLESRVALLRLSGSRVNPVQGQLGDLSTSGFSIRFANEELGATHAALADAVVAVDIDLPGPNGALRLAAQVRWLDSESVPGETRLGIEFVLLTEPDRRRIAGTLAKAALAAHAAGRKAA